jgi:phage terminase large subunit-like protein
MGTLVDVLKIMGLEYELNKTDWIFTLHNGSEVWICGLDSPEEAEKILGTEFSTIFYNECNQIPYEAIDTANTRLAEKNILVKKAFYDCNPPNKAHWVYFKFIKLLDPVDKTPIAGDTHVHVQMNPKDNIENIDENYLKRLNAMSKAKRKRFLEGEFTDEVTGKVFDQQDISDNRVDKRDYKTTDMDILIVAVDPNMTSQKDSDDCGIILLGKKSGDKHVYVFSDKTMIRPKPSAWARRTAAIYHHNRCVAVVAEGNQGGDLVKETIKNAQKEGEMPVVVKVVYASRGKFARAEPVAELYELGFIHHVGIFEELEDQMTSFDPDESKKSPDRMDALVWGVTYLTAGTPVEFAGAEEDEYDADVKDVMREINMQDVYSLDELCEMDHLFN